MKQINEQLSSLLDNEEINPQALNTLINDEDQQHVFSRYQLIGDVMRNERAMDIDISQKIMAEIAAQPILATVTPIGIDKQGIEKTKGNNVVSFRKRFGQYAIAASVAGVVIMTSFMTSQTTLQDTGIKVLNTVPFGGSASPVSLQANQQLSQKALKERHDRLEALLQDHQLQLQIQP